MPFVLYANDTVCISQLDLQDYYSKSCAPLVIVDMDQSMLKCDAVGPLAPHVPPYSNRDGL